MQFRQRRHTDLPLNLTPLIDIVFLLLIFFVLTAQFIEPSQLNLSLPTADGVTYEQQDSITISIYKDGSVEINNELLSQPTIAMLSDKIKNITHNNATPVTIYADAIAPYQAVINVLDVLNQLQFNTLTLATQRNQHNT